jgi:hypothetical protein
MRTPSNRSGIPTVPVVALLGLILFLGLALAPAAFKFRTWPVPTRPDVLEEIVARPDERVVESPAAARVKSARDESLAARGSNGRGRASGTHAELDARGAAREPRAARRGRSAGSDRSRRSRGNRADDAVLVVEVPASPAPPAPVDDPEQPAQLVEVPPADAVMRPEPEPVVPEQTPAPLAPYDPDSVPAPKGRRSDDGDDWDGYADDSDGERKGRHGRGRGHRQGRGHTPGHGRADVVGLVLRGLRR